MKRRYYLKRLCRYLNQGKRILYLDESGFVNAVQRQHAYAMRGIKTHGLRSGHTRPRTSLLAARIKGGAFIAPFLFNGSCNADLFNAWLVRDLAPYLTANDVIVMDNATFHKTSKTKEIVTRTGAQILFLPPYSPDLNPIEQDFATLKKIREYNHETSIDNIVKTYQ